MQATAYTGAAARKTDLFELELRSGIIGSADTPSLRSLFSVPSISLYLSLFSLSLSISLSRARARSLFLALSPHLSLGTPLSARDWFIG